MSLKQRIERMEKKLKPGELRAAIQGLLDPSGAPGALEPDDPALQQGVDQNCEAFISRWWSVWFFEDNKEQQEARLNALRQDPQFQGPWIEGEFPVRLEGGACCEDAYTRIQEQEQNRH